MATKQSKKRSFAEVSTTESSRPKTTKNASGSKVASTSKPSKVNATDKPAKPRATKKAAAAASTGDSSGASTQTAGSIGDMIANLHALQNKLETEQLSLERKVAANTLKAAAPQQQPTLHSLASTAKGCHVQALQELHFPHADACRTKKLVDVMPNVTNITKSAALVRFKKASTNPIVKDLLSSLLHAVAEHIVLSLTKSKTQTITNDLVRNAIERVVIQSTNSASTIGAGTFLNDDVVMDGTTLVHHSGGGSSGKKGSKKSTIVSSDEHEQQQQEQEQEQCGGAVVVNNEVKLPAVPI